MIAVGCIISDFTLQFRKCFAELQGRKFLKINLEHSFRYLYLCGTIIPK